MPRLFRKSHAPYRSAEAPRQPEASATLGSGADGGRFGDRDRLVFAVGLGLRLSAFADVNAALEIRAVFYGNAGGDNVAGERAVAADIHAVAGGQIAAHFAQHDDFAGVDVGGDHAVAANGDAIAGKIDGTFDPAVNIKRLGAGDFTLDDQRLADGGLVGGGGRHGARRWRFRRDHGGRAGGGHSRALRLGRAARSLRLIRRLPHG